MTRLHWGPLVLAVSAAAIAATGCGGSGRNATTGTSGSGPAVLGPSTPIGSPAYRAFTERGIARIPGVPMAAIPKIVNCVIQKQLSQGITTVGAVSAHQSEVNADGVACAHQAGLH